jgi:uncharacterized protein (TIGR03435 family)
MRQALSAAWLFLTGSCACAQLADSRPAFEVASVKVSDFRTALPMAAQGKLHIGMSGGPGTNEPGRFTCNLESLTDLILRAYGIKRYQLNKPTWFDSQFYDIAARVPEGATAEQFATMIQRLLEERFKLALHKDRKELSLYDLTVGKGGPKLVEAVEPTAPQPDAKPQKAPVSPFDEDGYPIIPPNAKYRMAIRGGRTTMRLERITMEEFAQQVTDMVGRPVIDTTGLKGKYDITLHYIQDPPGRNGGPPPAATPDAGPTVSGALQSQLGLRLEPRKGIIEILVVDHAEKIPTEN